MMTLVTQDSVVGADILSLITRGMYDNPLVLFREYVQNSVDAVASTERTDTLEISVALDAHLMSVTIRDNGPGLSYQDAISDLVAVANSRKVGGRDAGFRGIGRLVGLAFAQEVEFLTRCSERESVTRVVWSGDALRRLVSQESRIDRVVEGCVSVSTICGEGYPSHFFEVRLLNVARFVSDRLLNVLAVSRYISEVCPVGTAHEFPFSSQVSQMVSQFVRSVTPTITINGQGPPILRRYGGSISYSPSRKSRYISLESFDLPTIEGEAYAAVGWLAHSTYDGAIPTKCGVRGLRIRCNNIAIGDEKVLDHLFVEERFNRWCVGEIHILDHRIVPNARRDYFEINPHLRNFEHHLRPIVASIVRKCRTASASRNRIRRSGELVEWATGIYGLVSAGFVSSQCADSLVQRAIYRLDSVRESSRRDAGESWSVAMEVVYQQLVRFESNPNVLLDQRLTVAETDAFRSVIEALVAETNDARTALRIGKLVISRMSG